MNIGLINLYSLGLFSTMAFFTRNFIYFRSNNFLSVFTSSVAYLKSKIPFILTYAIRSVVTFLALCSKYFHDYDFKVLLVKKITVSSLFYFKDRL